MRRDKELVHAQPDDPEAGIMPCRMTLVTAPATHAQRQAWACLWRRLLGEDVDHNGRSARGSEGETHEK